jgi:hypothetical protein
MIKQIGAVVSYSIAILFSAVLGIIHLVILLVLGALGIAAAGLTLAMPIFGLLRSFGWESIFIIWNDLQVPKMLGLPLGIFLGFLFAILSLYCFRAFMKYFHFISKKN